MESVPDYPSYSYSQLRDALEHINKERYPENYAALKGEIQRREEMGTLNESRNVPFPYGIVDGLILIPTFAAAYLGLYLGKLGVLLLVFAFPWLGTRDDLPPVLSLVFGLILILLSFLCFVPAYFCWERHKR